MLIDEATSGVDNHTDRVIQQVIGSRFESKTVVTIAHRMQTVTHSCRRIMVVKDGEIVEVGQPNELMKDRDSELYRLQMRGMKR